MTDSRYKDNTEDSQWYAELCRGLEQTGALEKALTKMENSQGGRATRSKVPQNSKIECLRNELKNINA